jgi:hypothetical protein
MKIGQPKLSGRIGQRRRLFVTATIQSQIMQKVNDYGLKYARKVGPFLALSFQQESETLGNISTAFPANRTIEF